MTDPETLGAPATDEEKARGWINAAREHLITSEEADADERIYFGDYLNAAEEVVPLLESFRVELARLYDANQASRSFDIRGFQIVVMCRHLDVLKAQIGELTTD